MSLGAKKVYGIIKKRQYLVYNSLHLYVLKIFYLKCTTQLIISTSTEGYLGDNRIITPTSEFAKIKLNV